MQRLERTNFGSPERLHTSGGLRVSVTNYAGDSALPWHEYDDAYLCLVAAGSYTQQSSGRDTDCRRDLLLVHPRGQGRCAAQHGDRFKVSWVVPGGPAAEAGLRKGDEIVAVDGKPVRAIGGDDLRQASNARNEGAVLALKLADGRSLRITMRDLAPR